MEAIWKDVARRTKDFIKHPDRFLENENNETFDKSKLLLKVLYDGTKIATDEVDGAAEKFHKNVLPELLIEDFDEEQVWTAVELQNKSILDECQNAISNLLNLNTSSFDLSGGTIEEITEERRFALEEEDENNDDDEVNFSLSTELHEAVENEDENDDDDDMEDESEVDSEIENEIPEGNANEEDSIMNDPDFQHMSDSDLDDNLPLFDKTDSDDESDLDETNTDEKDNKKKEVINEKEAKEIEIENKAQDYIANAMKALKSQGGGGGSFKKDNNALEDQFFRIDEMEKFLDAEDRKVTKPSEDNEDDDDVDYFGSDFEDEDEEGLNELKKIKYKDYFDPVTGTINEEEIDDTNNFRNENSQDLLKSDSELDEDESEKEDLGEIKSSHELKTMRLQKKIKAMEENALEVKPWQMTGEVAAVERPENALLEEDLEYDTVSKQAPIITEAVSKRLEDIITQRIKDEAWDDVERKIKPVENPYDFKKKLILDQEKSKLSLSQVYEEEYLKQKGDAEAALKAPGMLDDDDIDNDKPELVDEIKSRMKELFVKLDTLTHYHYTPQALNAEVKVVRNLPTIAMEEVAPVAMNDATLLAPQEISDKKRGEAIGTSERSDTDKKRDLRLKKAKQRKKKQSRDKKEKLISKLNATAGGVANTKYSKKAAEKVIEQAAKEGRVQTIKDKAKSVKSSTAFFDKIQNEVRTVMTDLKAEKSLKKKSKKNVNVAALKL